MQNCLIFDIGCHQGDDSDFYLKKGFNVIGVEANPALCADLKRKFAGEISEGRFVLVERAIAEQAGEISFFANENVSIWGTIREDVAKKRNVSLEYKIVVPAITFASLIQEYGVPYYLKIDIEGADLLCLEGLLEFDERPAFVSFEHDQDRYSSLQTEMNLLNRLGYSKFQIVDQGTARKQKPPHPAREGTYLDALPGSSGLFGKELPEQWLTYNDTIMEYRRIYLNDRLDGVTKRIPFLRNFRRRAGSWYDTHATR